MAIDHLYVTLIGCCVCDLSCFACACACACVAPCTCTALMMLLLLFLGTALGEIPNVEKRLSNTKPSEPEIKKLHAILFPHAGKGNATVRM